MAVIKWEKSARDLQARLRCINLGGLQEESCFVPTSKMIWEHKVKSTCNRLTEAEKEGLLPGNFLPSPPFDWQLSQARKAEAMDVYCDDQVQRNSKSAVQYTTVGLSPKARVAF